MEILVTLAYLTTGIIIGIIISSFKKTKKHGTETSQQAQQKLLRFTRGNKALSPKQQQELFHLNEKNLNEIKRGLREMKNTWKNEHL